jgi:hypothetical protein
MQNYSNPITTHGSGGDDLALSWIVLGLLASGRICAAPISSDSTKPERIFVWIWKQVHAGPYN